MRDLATKPDSLASSFPRIHVLEGKNCYLKFSLTSSVSCDMCVHTQINKCNRNIWGVCVCLCTQKYMGGCVCVHASVPLVIIAFRSWWEENGEISGGYPGLHGSGQPQVHVRPSGLAQGVTVHTTTTGDLRVIPRAQQGGRRKPAPVSCLLASTTRAPWHSLTRSVCVTVACVFILNVLWL